MIRHQRQTAFHIGPSHWVLARPDRGVWAVIETTAQASFTHSHHRRRAHAEVMAEAIAATRIHNNLTAEDPR